MINNANFEYLSGIMRRDGIDAGEHVAFQTRDMGNGIQQRSPLFEIDGIDGKVWTKTRPLSNFPVLRYERGFHFSSSQCLRCKQMTCDLLVLSIIINRHADSPVT